MVTVCHLPVLEELPLSEQRNSRIQGKILIFRYSMCINSNFCVSVSLREALTQMSRVYVASYPVAHRDGHRVTPLPSLGAHVTEPLPPMLFRAWCECDSLGRRCSFVHVRLLLTVAPPSFPCHPNKDLPKPRTGTDEETQ